MRLRLRSVAPVLCALIAAVAAPALPAWADAAPAAKDGAWTVLFRSDDPTLWGQTKGKPTDPNGFALPDSAAPADSKFVRLKRMDTGACVIAPGTFKDLQGSNVPLLWADGSVTWRTRSGIGVVLGIADRFAFSNDKDAFYLQKSNGRDGGGFQGWGFARSLGPSTDQGYTWAGQRIGQTPFEVAVAPAITPSEEPWLLRQGTVKLISATWGTDPPRDVAADLRQKMGRLGYSFRPDATSMGAPAAGDHVLHVLYNINGEDHNETCNEGEVVRLAAPAVRILGPSEKQPGPLTIDAAKWSSGATSLDVTPILRKALKDGKLDMPVETGALGNPGVGYKDLQVNYQLGGRHLVAHFTDHERLLLGDQVVTLIDIKLPARAPVAVAAAAPAKPAAGSDQLLRTQNTIKSLSVTIDGTGRMFGNAEDFIMTASPGTPREDTPVNFVGKAGPEMAGVRDDVVRYLHVKYPKWPASKVDLSFEEREIGKDGGSIGAAVGTLLLSMLQGYDVDTHLAITGDVSADGKIRPIGGVAAKLRGAATAGATIVVIPAGNYDQLTDAVVYGGSSLLINTHVIGAATLEDAAAIARTDRPEAIAAAVKLFDDLQPELKKFPEHVHVKNVQDILQQIVTLVPNDFSARMLLAIGQNKAPKKLSSIATLYYMSIADRQVGPTLRDRSKLDSIKSTMTPVAVQQGLNELFKLRGMGAPEVMPLLEAEVKLIQGINNVEIGRAVPQSVLPLIQNFEDAESRLKSDHGWMEKLLKEGI